jgi:transposase
VITQRIYAHTQTADALAAMSALDKILRNAAGTSAEIGDITGFARAEQLTCWAGLTPKHHESDTHVHRGSITKQGSRLVRWAVIESVQILPKTTHVGGIWDRIGAKRGPATSALWPRPAASTNHPRSPALQPSPP